MAGSADQAIMIYPRTSVDDDSISHFCANIDYGSRGNENTVTDLCVAAYHGSGVN
jgi:hypothetical protein